MARVKRGVTATRRHKRLLKLTKGQRDSKHALYRRAHEAFLKSFSYAYRHRRERKRDMRKLWIARINAACRANGMAYSRLINGLRVAGIEIDRKMLSEIAIHDGDGFAAIVGKARAALNGRRGAAV